MIITKQHGLLADPNGYIDFSYYPIILWILWDQLFGFESSPRLLSLERTNSTLRLLTTLPRSSKWPRVTYPCQIGSSCYTIDRHASSGNGKVFEHRKNIPFAGRTPRASMTPPTKWEKPWESWLKQCTLQEYHIEAAAAIGIATALLKRLIQKQGQEEK